MGKRTYILYDSRAMDDPDDASVLVVCSSDKEARSFAGDFGGMACFSYAIEGKNLTDQQFEWNWYPGMGFSDRTQKRNGKR